MMPKHTLSPFCKSELVVSGAEESYTKAANSFQEAAKAQKEAESNYKLVGLILLSVAALSLLTKRKK